MGGGGGGESGQGRVGWMLKVCSRLFTAVLFLVGVAAQPLWDHFRSCILWYSLPCARLRGRPRDFLLREGPSHPEGAPERSDSSTTLVALNRAPPAGLRGVATEGRRQAARQLPPTVGPLNLILMWAARSFLFLWLRPLEAELRHTNRCEFKSYNDFCPCSFKRPP